MTSQLEVVREKLEARRRPRPGPPHVIGVVSGRGGVGVSLVSALLAIRSANAGLRTLLVDAEPWMEVQRVWLGQPRGSTLDELKGSDMDAESLVRVVHGQLELLSLGAAETLSRERRSLLRRIPPLFSDRDIVVVDAGSRLEGLERVFDLRVGSVLVVSGSDAVGLAATHAMIKAVAGKGEVPTAVLFNRLTEAEAASAGSVLTEGAVRFLRREVDIVGSLPDDRALSDPEDPDALLPERLVSSTLPHLVTGVMTNLLPWRSA